MTMGRARTAGGLAALMVVSLALRSTALDAGYWIDEGLSVGIASHPLDAIPGILRQDGSPPLYYLLLHIWMAVFGEHESATHALSLLLALGAIPVAWWAGRLVDGERCAWIAAALAATNGFLTYYAQETRMYALVALLSLLAAALAVRVFADRDGHARPWLVMALAAVALTHNWGLFLAAATLVAGSLTGMRSADPDGSRDPQPRTRPLRRREYFDGLLVRDGALVAAGVMVLYLVWLPTLAFQAAHTGAPWSQTPRSGDLMEAFGGALGGTGPALVLLAAGAAAIVLQSRGPGPVAPVAGRRSGSGRGAPVALLAFSALGTVGLAFIGSQIEPAWAGRYGAVAVGPLILLAACLLGRAGRLGLVALAVVCALGLADPRTGRLERKDNVRAVAAGLRSAGIGAGDIVISAHPERGPVLRHYLGSGPRYADLLGPVPDAQVFDWRDALDRLQRAAPARTADPLVVSLRGGGRLVLVVPELRAGSWTAPWTRLVRERARAWQRSLDGDPRLRRVAAVPARAGAPRPRTVQALVFRRVM